MAEKYTPKQRMLNAYKGIFSDRYPVAPEFWYYYPAKTLGVGMMEFEREIPFWAALKKTFEKYGCEGWGAAFPSVSNANLDTDVTLKKINGTQYLETTRYNHRGNKFTTEKLYDEKEPSWLRKYLADDLMDLPAAIDMLLDPENAADLSGVIQAHTSVGDSYLLEMWMGAPFFDFIAGLTGFEKAVEYFYEEDKDVLLRYRERYSAYQKELIGNIARNTDYECFAIGCSCSCNSLLGPVLWREWDKPYIKEMAEVIHGYGKLLHVHFHGRCIETAGDFAELGIDCVCPFERPPGGDVSGIDGLKAVRALLEDKTAMNGNVHTVETLIRGDAAKVVGEVREIKEAFDGSARLVIGTGDQVGAETPEDNIYAMIEEARRVT